MRQLLRTDRFIQFGLVLIAVQAIIRSVVLHGAFFWQDDYVHLAQASQQSWSSDFFFQDYNDHFEPATYVVFQFLSLAGLDFTAAAILMVLLQTVASLMLLWCMWTLFGSQPLALLTFAAYLFTPLGLAAGTWLSAALQALPLQICLLAAIGCTARHRRGDGLRWGIAAVAALIVGLSFWEKALFIGPATLAAHLLITCRGTMPRAVLRELREGWRLWAGFVVVSVGYIAIYLARVDLSTNDSAADSDLAKLVNDLIGHTFIPGLFGGPWTGGGALNTLAAQASTVVVGLTVGALVLLVVSSLVLRGLPAVFPWLFIIGYLAVDVLLVNWGRAAFTGLVSRDPRYVTDALPLMALAVTAAFVPTRAWSWRAGWLGRLSERIQSLLTPMVAAVGVALLATGSLLTTTQIADTLQHGYSRTFSTTAVDAARQDPSMVLVDSSAPPVEVAAQPVSVIFQAAQQDVLFDRPTTHLEMLNGFGEPRPVELIAEEVTERGPLPDCGWAVGSFPRVLADLPPSERAVLRIGYLSASAANLEVSVGGVDLEPLRVPSGLGVADFPIVDMSGPVEVAARPDAGTSLCVSDVTVGKPWPS